jgi:hypothetical protein
VRPRTLLTAGIAAAGLFGAAAVGLLALLDQPGRPAQGAPLADPAAAASVPPVTLPAAYLTSTALATERIPEPPARPGIRGARIARATSAWDDVPVAAREQQLGPVAPHVRAALSAARDQMDTCFEEEDARQRAQPARAPRAGADTVRGPGVLVLRLESRQDGLDVVGTEVESYGTSSRELARCAGQVLTGWPIEAQGATAGMRYRLKFLLQ